MLYNYYRLLTLLYLWLYLCVWKFIKFTYLLIIRNAFYRFQQNLRIIVIFRTNVHKYEIRILVIWGLPLLIKEFSMSIGLYDMSMVLFSVEIILFHIIIFNGDKKTNCSLWIKSVHAISTKCIYLKSKFLICKYIEPYLPDSM